MISPHPVLHALAGYVLPADSAARGRVERALAIENFTLSVIQALGDTPAVRAWADREVIKAVEGGQLVDLGRQLDAALARVMRGEVRVAPAEVSL